MKKITLVVMITFVIYACKKDSSNSIVDNNGNCRLIKFVQGFPGDDTTYTFHYNDTGQMVSLVDEGYADSSFLVYNDQQEMFVLRDADGRAVYAYGYNEKGKLSVVNSAGSKTELTYEQDTIISGAAVYARNGNTWEFWRSYEFDTDNDGDITAIREYTSGGQQTGQRLIVYTNTANPFRSLALLNYENSLGIEDIYPLFEFGFMPSKLMIGYDDGNAVYQMQYENDGQGRITKSMVTRNIPGEAQGTFTRTYEYECM